MTRNMAEPLRRTVAAMGEPRVVVAVGDCAIDCGEFAGGYGVEGAVADVVPVDLQVPGCPPGPEKIIAALRTVTGRLARSRLPSRRPPDWGWRARLPVWSCRSGCAARWWVC
ncbi:hypothetical protein ACFYO2_47270 [Streptomyces sp. NPDC006602]|uniref:NADH-quinone oxidoreductase subunit B family protein n=1 Tax=Streptomyces sp. NPDC006602 TaxID=3364751 RepID=UPI0036BA23D2